jgi:hypothetical protein
MPWILRFAIVSLFAFVIGAVMIAWACMSTGWETLSWFAWGCVTAGAGLIGAALLAIVSAVDLPSLAQIFSRAHECVGPAVSSTPDFCQVCMIKPSALRLLNSSKWVMRCRVMTRLVVILLLTLLLTQLASAKRVAPVKVAAVIYEGIRYVAPNDDGRRGYIEAWNIGTNKKRWALTIFTNGIDPNLEEDIQWVFIKALNIQDGRLMVTSERGKTYQVDVNTKAIMQPDSLSSPSPGAIRDVPDVVKSALTNGSLGKEYDLSFRINPFYLEGDFNCDGKMDIAVFVKERATGKLGIAIVHGTTEKVDNSRGRHWHRQRWRRLRMDGLVADLLQGACRPRRR